MRWKKSLFFKVYALHSAVMLGFIFMFLHMQYHASISSPILKNNPTTSMVLISNTALQHLITEAADAKYIRAVFNASFPTLPHKNSSLIPWKKNDKSIAVVTKNKSARRETIATSHCTYQQADYFNQDMININQTWFVCEKINNTFRWQVISQKSF